MKRLFMVRYNTKKSSKPMYFDNKMKAKGFRNEHKGTRVSLGPDHRRYVK